ncbi:MAG: PEP/pyruvate-binding domain-containing protein [Planctomycetota bacterium]
MQVPDEPTQRLLDALQERAKELNCLYRVDEILSNETSALDEIYDELLRALPAGWKYPSICRGVLRLDTGTWPPGAVVDTLWQMSAPVRVQGEKIGRIIVFYTEERPTEDEGPFLQEERRLINAIADRIGLFVMRRRLKGVHDTWDRAVRDLSSAKSTSWEVLLEFLGHTDPNLLHRLSKRMINHLCWYGVDEAKELLHASMPGLEAADYRSGDENKPLGRGERTVTNDVERRIFILAVENLGEKEFVSMIQLWINEQKSTHLIKSLENPGTGLAELAEAVERYQHARIDEAALPVAVRTSLKVALLRRFCSEQLEYINVAKLYVDVQDFYGFAQRLIYPSRGQGKLGGKGAGLLLANHVLRKATEYADVLADLRVPKTWYVASDAVLEFIQYNDLSEVYNRKYMDIERVRQDYPNIIQLFKGCRFPPGIVKGLGAALDEFEDAPIIVRSSSLLEDRVGASFSGKYKSLFLANQGTKREKLEALLDAIAEVYASVFGPDPIEYRAERGLLDFREEMGILIQEVVGKRVGKYFLPAYSGVAFSNNEYRWSPRIQRQDGLVRLVPGLGTRAVDRLTDDYPVLFAPGQPRLRVNATTDEIVRYSPKMIDVLDLEKNSFESVRIADFLRECGEEFPLARDLVSIVEGDRIRQPIGLEPDWAHDECVMTFEGLLRRQSFVVKMQTVLKVLREKLGMPVDIEFASDGEHFYLVQCRSQSRSEEHRPAAIPRDLPKNRILFTARRFVSNGEIGEITHVVYVDPERYSKLRQLEELRRVGQAVSRLNKILPRRQFVLMGPGRWGSRGDIRLGVSVTYSDINNTAALLEIARRKGDYLPELSFGTHFFQDLVETDIRYIPLYPDDPGVVFNERFFLGAKNILPGILPEYGDVADTLRVIDVPAQTEGRILRVLLNADLDEAVGILDASRRSVETIRRDERRLPRELPATGQRESDPRDHSLWRQRMAERIAAVLDPVRFGVKGLYVFGSTKNATAAPKSDLDLIVHFCGDAQQRRDLETWLEGWSLSLAENNYFRTGYHTDGLLDVHFVTDEDIRTQTSFASKIGAITDAARRLPLRGESAE